MICFDTAENTSSHIKAINKAGIIAVCRYYTASTTSWKCISLNEAKALSNANISIVPVYQMRQTEDADFSKSLGKTAGINASKFARNIGQPLGSGIYFAVDYDPSEDTIDGRISDYFQAVNDHIAGKYTIGVYGSGATCQSLLSNKLVSYTWLSQSRGFSGTKDFDRWNLKQLMPTDLFDMNVDQNEINFKMGYFGSFLLD
jgi:Domain of unknown function (DUF1906)